LPYGSAYFVPGSRSQIAAQLGRAHGGCIRVQPTHDDRQDLRGKIVDQRVASWSANAAKEAKCGSHLSLV
jgi:hypothetical protein